jgi:hypothetical protein
MPRKPRPALNDGHTLHLADEYHPDPRIAAAAVDAKATASQPAK